MENLTFYTVISPSAAVSDFWCFSVGIMTKLILIVLVAFAGQCISDHGILMPPPVNSYGFPMTPGEQGHSAIDPAIDSGQIGGHANSQENVYQAAVPVSNKGGHETASSISITEGHGTAIDEYLLADIANQVAQSGTKASAQSSYQPTVPVSSNAGDDNMDFQVISALGEIINGYRKGQSSAQGDYPSLSAVDSSNEGQKAAISSYQTPFTSDLISNLGHYTGNQISSSIDGLTYGSSVSGSGESYNGLSIPNDYLVTAGTGRYDGSVATAPGTQGGFGGDQTTHSNGYGNDHSAKKGENIVKGQMLSHHGSFEVIYSPEIRSHSGSQSQQYLDSPTVGLSQQLGGHTGGHSQKLSGHSGGHSHHNGGFHVGQSQQNVEYGENQLQQIAVHNANHQQYNGGFTPGHSRPNIDYVVNHLQQDGGFNHGQSQLNFGNTGIQQQQNGGFSQGHSKPNYAGNHGSFNGGHSQQNIGYSGNQLQQDGGFNGGHSQQNIGYTGNQLQQVASINQVHSQQSIGHPGNHLQQTGGHAGSHVFSQNTVEVGETNVPKNIAYTTGGQKSTHNGGPILVQGPTQHVGYTGGQISPQKYIAEGPFSTQNGVQGAGLIPNGAYDAPPTVIHHEGDFSTAINYQSAPIEPTNINFRHPTPIIVHPVSAPPSHNFNGYNAPKGLQFDFTSPEGQHTALSVSAPTKPSRPMQLEINPIPAVHRSISFVRGYLTRKLKALDSLGSRAEQMLSSIPVIQIEFSKDDKKS